MMNITGDVVRTFVVVLILTLVSLQTSSANPPVGYSVTTTNDSGIGSLRQAILNVNAAPVSNIISFNLSGQGPFTINLLSPLPVITNPVMLDGTTQAGYAGTPIIALNGSAAGTGANGLYLTGGNSTVQGLLVENFGGAGIVLDINGTNVIQNNFVGTDTTGTINFGNGCAGILIAAGSGNVIGGYTISAANVIAFNGGAGVAIVVGINNLVRDNSIFSNVGPAIDLGNRGTVLQNHTGGVAAGPNNLQNYPVISGIDASGAMTEVYGSFSSTPNTTYQIDFYYSPTLDSNGFGDGTFYLGSSSVATDANGNAPIVSLFQATIPNGSYVSAVATDPSGNSSEFAAPVQFTASDPVNLSLTMSSSSNAVLLGEQVALTLTLTNSSTNTATGVTVYDWLPMSLTYDYSAPSQGTTSTSSNCLVWNVGALPGGQAATMTFYATSTSAGWVTNWTIFTQDEFNANYLNRTNQIPVDVYVPAPATITSQPSGITLNLGQLLSLNILTSGGPSSLKYQWRLNGADIPGATNSTYSKPLLSSDGGNYTTVVSDQYGANAVESQPALVLLGGLNQLPANDNFANRGQITLINGLLGLILGPMNGNNTNATSEPGEPMHAGVPGGKSVWVSWTPLLSGVATFTTQGSSFDTLLAVYTGNSVSNLTPVVSDDDSGGYYTSTVTFYAQGGTTYNIAIDGAYGASGQIVFSGGESLLGLLSPSPPQINSQPADQIVAPGSPAIFSTSASGSGLSYQWNFNGTAIPGATTTSLLVKNVSYTNVGQYTVTVANSSASIVSRHATLQTSMLDGSLNTNGIAQEKFQAIYTLVSNALGSAINQVSSFGVSSFHIRPFGGGTSRGYSSTQTFSTYGDQTQSGEPNTCENVGGSSAWTSMQSPNTGILTINTAGSSFTTILGVYTGNGNDFSSLTQIACSVGISTRSNSSVTFAATSNTVYYIAVDGVNAAYGTVVLNWSLSIPPAITAQPGSQTASPGSTITLNASATGYATPNCQWWLNGAKLAGATNGTLTITNFQSTKVGNYQMVATNSVGMAVTMPASILLNNALHLDTFSFNKTSHACQMRLVGAANTTYYIQGSSDLQHWVTLATNTPTSGLWTFTDSHATNSARFYRAVPAP